MKLKLIAGLGNYGDKYAGIYHNIGASFVNFLQTYAEFTPWLERIVLLPPQGFMNESGQLILAEMKRLGATSETTLLAHDDSDISLAGYQLIRERGAAGHNGVQSVFDAAQSNSFWRARIGIRSANEERKSLEFVLQPIPPEELPIFKEVFKKIADEIIAALKTP